MSTEHKREKGKSRHRYKIRLEKSEENKPTPLQKKLQ
jgi:hypothetical protein